ncbi:MAG TPA: 3-methyl-2-oxobutanoate dehydrogenase subunit VorB [Bacteroidota bacterium]|jgi:2-oxoglutarate ferredoxin oxidoreductase subunit alpha|nr:3-methyl-2-oxobutanoate dehydrogenase subunit VorB [Bacteroidota bacterium]
MSEVRLMKGNEALAEAAIRAGCKGYFGYPITPQSEILEYLADEGRRRGMVVMQVESEVAAINMVYGASGAGARVMTSSSSPGISLMQEGLSYIASAELPCLVVNVNRGGPGLGTIQPSQGDYFQATKGGGHGDYRLIVLAPSSVQEMADFVFLGFDLADKYRNPVMILSDGALGQMMEKVVFEPYAAEEHLSRKDWATTGKSDSRERNIITSLHIQPEKMEEINRKLQAKYSFMNEEEVRFESYLLEDAQLLVVAYGLAARICQRAVDTARSRGIPVGLLRPQTLFPFPQAAIRRLCQTQKGVLVTEMNAGQMVEDVRLAVNGEVPVEFYGRTGGIIPTPEEVLNQILKFSQQLGLIEHEEDPRSRVLTR